MELLDGRHDTQRAQPLALDHQLAKEVPGLHGAVGFRDFLQGEYPAHDAMEGAAMDQLHQVREGALAAASAAHQVQGT